MVMLFFLFLAGGVRLSQCLAFSLQFACPLLGHRLSHGALLGFEQHF